VNLIEWSEWNQCIHIYWDIQCRWGYGLWVQCFICQYLSFGIDPTLVPSGTEPFTVATFSPGGGTGWPWGSSVAETLLHQMGESPTVAFGAPNLEMHGLFPKLLWNVSAPAPPWRLPLRHSQQARVKYYPGTNRQNWIGGDWCQAYLRHPTCTEKLQAQDMHGSGDEIKSGSGLCGLSSIYFHSPHQILIHRIGLWRGC